MINIMQYFSFHFKMYNLVRSGSCVDFSTAFRKLLLTFIALGKGATSLTLETKDVVVNLQDNTKVSLNCTFQKEDFEEIENRDIRWQKLIRDSFEDVAIFSPHGGTDPFLTVDLLNVYNNRTDLVAPNSSLSALVIISNVTCNDGGVFRCWIHYFNKVKLKEFDEYSNSSVIFTGNAKKPNLFQISSNELEEKSSVGLNCSADVGAPEGNIKIWKLAQNSNRPEIIYTSTDIHTENCTHSVSVSHMYTVIRGDNGALFQCSSQNSLNNGVGPSLKSGRISVIYGPGEPSVLLNPNKSSFYVGEDLTLSCSADSNPPSNFTWTFQSTKHFHGIKDLSCTNKIIGSRLILQNIQLDCSGEYTCTASNDLGRRFQNVSVNVRVRIDNPQTTTTGCAQCGHTETCQYKNGEAHCITNAWIPVAIISIVISIIFGIAITVLIKQKIINKGKQSTNSSYLHIQLSPSRQSGTEDLAPRASTRESEDGFPPYEKITETQNESESK
ncbi:cell adhesion molecule 3-like isoform X2 [Crassostrea virginica]